jgi:hypothetical protein
VSGYVAEGRHFACGDGQCDSAKLRSLGSGRGTCTPSHATFMRWRDVRVRCVGHATFMRWRDVRVRCVGHATFMRWRDVRVRCVGNPLQHHGRTGGCMERGAATTVSQPFNEYPVDRDSEAESLLASVRHQWLDLCAQTFEWERWLRWSMLACVRVSVAGAFECALCVRVLALAHNYEGVVG